MTIYQNTIQALQLTYDHQLDCQVMDINKAGESYDVGLLDFNITMNRLISGMSDRLEIVEKMRTATTNQIAYLKRQKGSSSALTSLGLKAQFQEIDSLRLGNLETQLKAREFQYDMLYNRLKAHLDYFQDKTGDVWQPYQAKNPVKYNNISDDKKKAIHDKELAKTKQWYNDNYGKLEKPLDNEDGTISSELIPAYA
tara:strand:- start:348 stop:938 length:591 start_codon:yes stop_codon:yes gene_type:complete